MTDTRKPGAAGNSHVTTTTQATQATRHACTRCGHSGDYSGPGPHACPGCGELLRAVEHLPGLPRPSERELLLLALASLHGARSELVTAADALDDVQERIESVLSRLAGAQGGAA